MTQLWTKEKKFFCLIDRTESGVCETYFKYQGHIENIYEKEFTDPEKKMFRLLLSL